MSGLQDIINTAQSVDFTRTALVATSVSRSGRLLTASRNWVKPWKFTVEPKPYWNYDVTTRGMIENIMTNDRHTEQTIQLGQNSGSTWTIEYMGNHPRTSNVLNNITISSFTGTSLVIAFADANVDNGTYIFRAGDVIQPTGHRYPYVVTEDVVKSSGQTSKTVVVNRGAIPESGYTFTGKTITVGVGCSWKVKVSKLPSPRLVSGKLVEFADAFEFVESVI
jgi:hypothetical protein